MTDLAPNSTPVRTDLAVASAPDDGARAVPAVPTAAGQAALEAARALARNAAAPATLRAYKADWRHYAAWCADKGFAPIPAEPATVGAYLASLADSDGTCQHAPMAADPRDRGSPAPAQQEASWETLPRSRVCDQAWRVVKSSCRPVSKSAFECQLTSVRPTAPLRLSGRPCRNLR
jgi:hypothetical protein